MKIVFLTAGTGSYYCGACMRDNTLARELHRAGHDVTIAPMYLPLILDETTLDNARDVPVFFGGINVFLQQKLALFRHTPAWFDRMLNGTGLLKWAARRSHMTSARTHGEMMLEMLNVDESPLRKELDKLLEWLTGVVKPDLICLSNALLVGFAGELRRRLGAPIVTFFQGEDTFLDGLPEPYRSRAWAALKARLPASDLLISPTRFYADYMAPRLGLASADIAVVPNGIRLDGFSVADAPPAPPVIGYLARMSRDKGLDLLVEAFIALSRDLGDTTTRLHIAGAATAGDEPLIAQLKHRLADAGLAGRIEWLPNVTREQKIAFLRGLTLFSVPTAYPEAFGLYVVEAMACGVPVVQPATAAFPELIGAAGGGACVPPRDAGALARAWRDLLADAPRRTALGRAGRLGVEKCFSAPTMCAEFLRATARLTAGRV
ncbi:MAG: glycosyltransferase family 4 protein [Opitutaceae bacterium]|nr:glycosyltransferase family 4 protein [Opitutaceae bacterium]